MSRDAVPVPQRDTSPPLPAQDARAPTPCDSPGAAQTPFFEFFHDRVGADMQHAQRATCTVLLSAAVPLLALPGLAMADNIRALTVGYTSG